MSRRLLQLVNAVIAVFTIVLASMSLFLGVDSPIYEGANIPEFPVLDSNLRFFGGLGLGIGLVLLWITPVIEKETKLFRTLWFCALLGGIGRIVSMFMVGLPPIQIVIFTFIEVPLVPILMYWQWKVSQAK